MEDISISPFDYRGIDCGNAWRNHGNSVGFAPVCACIMRQVRKSFENAIIRVSMEAHSDGQSVCVPCLNHPTLWLKDALPPAQMGRFSLSSSHAFSAAVVSRPNSAFRCG